MTDSPAGRDDLPIPDYDHLPLLSLGHRIRSLSEQQLAALLAYEQAHGQRLPVVQIIETRRREVADGAPLSGGDPAGLAPELVTEAAGSTGVSPQTQGPPQNPPSHGDPTNPAQPRT